MEDANTDIPTIQGAVMIQVIDNDLTKLSLLFGSETDDSTSQEVREELQVKDSEDMLEEPIVSSSDVNELMESPVFQQVLNGVCQSVFNQFRPSPRYGEWQDLRQDVAIKFMLWVEEYQGQANFKVVLKKIATNLFIDDSRRQGALLRSYTQINLDDIDLEVVRKPDAEDIDAHILFAECRNELSARERLVFDEYFTEGRNLREIAYSHHLSPPAIVKTLQRILTKLKLLIESGKVSDKFFREASKSTSGGSERSQGGTNAFPTSQVERPEDKLEQMLLKEGLLSEIPPPITDFMGYRKRKPIKVKGKPISETIIEERR